MKEPLSLKAFKYYETKLYPKIKHIRGTHRLYVFIRSNFNTNLPKISDTDPENIFEKEDWDNLLILDACRHDLFEEVEGKTPYRYTLGSHSADFVRENFSNGDYSDLVVVTANPHYTEDIFEEQTGRKPENVFHAVWHTYKDKWDDRGTVTPESIIEDYKTARKIFPDKKILVHLMQPHNPFIESHLDGEEVDVTGFGKLQQKTLNESNEDHAITEWDYAQREVITDEEVWRAYRECLEYALDVIKKNRNVFEGNTIITSDHGNFAGEQGLYDHPKSREEEVLRKVPWVQLENL